MCDHLQPIRNSAEECDAGFLVSYIVAEETGNFYASQQEKGAECAKTSSDAENMADISASMVN